MTPIRQLRALEQGPRWDLVVNGTSHSLRIPDQGGAEYVLATLNNALCALAPSRIDLHCEPSADGPVAEAIASLHALDNASGVGILLKVAERIHGKAPTIQLHRRTSAGTPSEPPQANAPLPQRPTPQGLVVGIDIGGTDLKVVGLVGDEVVYTADPVWELPPRDFESGFSYLEPLRRHVRAAKRAAGVPLAGVGVSFPDLVIDDEVVGGITSKTVGMRNRTGGFTPAYWAVFDRTIRPLARLLADDVGAPVRIVNDGVAVASFGAAVMGGGSALTLSLGTSVAGASIDSQGRVGPFPLYPGGIVIRVADEPNTAHRTTGMTGTVQQYPCQGGIFRMLGERPDNARQRLKALQHETSSAVHAAFTQAGQALAETIAECRFWMGREAPDTTLLLGRLTEPSPQTGVLLRAASTSGTTLIRGTELEVPWPIEPQTLGQALGAALMARGLA